tara:strand:- start:3465 stop:5429 length:1965 start_codon:yes stop_codon:yes gene_type:complete
MCGFLGCVHKNTFEFSEDSFLRSLHEINHRGPDNTGFIQVEDGKNLLKLGHKRLTILDLNPTGNQPMSSQDGSCSIVFNGEIYNHNDFRIKLPNIPWRGTSDTETLLEIYHDQGIQSLLSSIRGMFSFCIYDKRKNILYLARDLAGEKPLYICTSNEYFGFSSEVSPFKSFPGFKKTLNIEAVNYFLKKNYIPHPLSIYEGIFKLPPASLMTIDLNLFKYSLHKSFEDFISSDGVKLESWWQMPRTQDKFELNSDVEVINKTEDILQKSVSQQLISDVPLGSFLSGGIDSSLIVALIKSCSEKNESFTVGYDFSDFDESIFAKKISKHLGIKNHTLMCSKKDVIDLIPHIPKAFSEPFADSSQIPTMLISKLARQSVKVILSGDAGDELFGGYNRYIYANKYWRFIDKVPNKLKSISPKLLSFFPKSFLNSLLSLTPLGEDFSKRSSSKIQKTLEKFSQIYDEKSFYKSLTEEWTEKDQVIQNMNTRHNVLPDLFSEDSSIKLEERMMKADFLTYLPDDILCKVDRSSMYFSLETRAPFLNRELIDFAFHLPLEYKIRDGKSKWVLRKILEKYVPLEFFDRPKQGFAIPISEWMRTDLKEWTNNMLSDELLDAHGLFNKDLIGKIKKEHLEGAYNHEHKLWSVVQFNQWYESNF